MENFTERLKALSATMSPEPVLVVFAARSKQPIYHLNTICPKFRGRSSARSLRDHSSHGWLTSLCSECLGIVSSLPMAQRQTFALAALTRAVDRMERAVAYPDRAVDFVSEGLRYAKAALSFELLRNDAAAVEALAADLSDMLDGLIPNRSASADVAAAAERAYAFHEVALLTGLPEEDIALFGTSSYLDKYQRGGQLINQLATILLEGKSRSELLAAVDDLVAEATQADTIRVNQLPDRPFPAPPADMSLQAWAIRCWKQAYLEAIQRATAAWYDEAMHRLALSPRVTAVGTGFWSPYPEMLPFLDGLTHTHHPEKNLAVFPDVAEIVAANLSRRLDGRARFRSYPRMSAQELETAVGLYQPGQGPLGSFLGAQKAALAI